MTRGRAYNRAAVKAYDLTHLVRRVGLLVLAAIGVHQLRYLVAYGSEGGAALEAQGHGYLSALLPDLAGGAALLTVATVAASAIGHRSCSASRTRLPQWLLCSISILIAFAFQELIEGLVSSGHPSGLAALSANGGWLALPLAIVFGVLVALALRLLDNADRVIVRLVEQRGRRRADSKPLAPRQQPAMTPARLALAFGFARRPPPVWPRSI